ncbi:MAG: hypothetical protein AAGF19_08315, partial [Pseudomonadota bacterium]
MTGQIDNMPDGQPSAGEPDHLIFRRQSTGQIGPQKMGRLEARLDLLEAKQTEAERRQIRAVETLSESLDTLAAEADEIDASTVHLTGVEGAFETLKGQVKRQDQKANTAIAAVRQSLDGLATQLEKSDARTDTVFDLLQQAIDKNEVSHTNNEATVGEVKTLVQAFASRLEGPTSEGEADASIDDLAGELKSLNARLGALGQAHTETMNAFDLPQTDEAVQQEIDAFEGRNHDAVVALDDKVRRLDSRIRRATRENSRRMNDVQSLIGVLRNRIDRVETSIRRRTVANDPIAVTEARPAESPEASSDRVMRPFLVRKRTQQRAVGRVAPVMPVEQEPAEEARAPHRDDTDRVAARHKAKDDGVWQTVMERPEADEEGDTPLPGQRQAQHSGPASGEKWRPFSRRPRRGGLFGLSVLALVVAGGALTWGLWDRQNTENAATPFSHAAPAGEVESDLRALRPGFDLTPVSLDWSFEPSALEIVEAAAKSGDAISQYVLGLSYHAGSGVTADQTKADYWQRRAAHQGLAAAQFSLAHRYASGLSGVTDQTKSFDWFLKAAEG